MQPSKTVINLTDEWAKSGWYEMNDVLIMTVPDEQASWWRRFVRRLLRQPPPMRKVAYKIVGTSNNSIEIREVAQ